MCMKSREIYKREMTAFHNSLDIWQRGKFKDYFQVSGLWVKENFVPLNLFLILASWFSCFLPTRDVIIIKLTYLDQKILTCQFSQKHIYVSIVSASDSGIS